MSCRWALVLLLLCGCQMIDRKLLVDASRNQIIRVENGDRYYFSLKEDVASGKKWYCSVDNPDVEVTIDHDGLDEADVRIRVHRGFSKSAHLRFTYEAFGAEEPLKTFTIGLFRRTGDVAFWK